MAGMSEVQKLHTEISQLMKSQYKINDRLQKKVGQLERRIVALENNIPHHPLIPPHFKGR